MKQQRHAILYITTPVLCLVLGFALIISQSGLPLDPRPLRLEALSASAQAEQTGGFDVLLLRQEEESPLLTTVRDTLAEMRLGYGESDSLSADALSRYDTVLVCDSALPALEGEGAVTLLNWVNQGGHAGFLCVPSVDSYLRIVSHKLGIMDGGREYREYNGLRVMPGVLDDFPAPQPEGFDELLQSQYGLSIQGFFRNHWWPDMKALSRRLGLRYTGVLVETYNKQMTPPFLPDTEDHALIRYYASELLQSGGEIGLHGYNHQPLCLDGWQYADEDYVTWASEENMAQAVEALVRYGRSFLPQAAFTSYVPPSNYLSVEGQRVLLRTVPELSVISGLYLPEDGINALVQEFREEADGSISVPRVTSGFSMDDYVTLVAAGELSLHGVFSHFIHPDDVLDVERGALLGWERMRDDFTASLEEIMAAYPALRWCTASEAAAAVQRYDRLGVTRQWDDNTLTLHLSSFFDEAWLCLCADAMPSHVEGAECYPTDGGCLWLRATQDTVRLEWEGGI